MKKRLALVTGGYSGEAVISYRSAQTIYNHLDKERFDIYKIDIHPTGWFYEDAAGARTEVDKNNFSIMVDNCRLTFDAVFIGMHGTPGEDGKLQGYFDMLGLPYTSCNAAASSLTFNKRYTTAVAGASGIAVAPSVLLFKNIGYSTDAIFQKLQLPYFVKPNNGGSSIGMSKVAAAGDLEAAIQKAFEHDEQVIVEQMISGREFTVGVFSWRNEIIVLPVTEVTAHNVFFDFEAKYGGKSTEITPAQIPEVWLANLQSTARKIYQTFNLRGVVRIDFIYNTAQEMPFMLEINTIPGQSDASIIPQQVKAMGWNLTDFYTRLVDACFKS